MPKERINYCITENHVFVGHSVNFPFVVEANTFEQLQVNSREMLIAIKEDLQRLIDSGEPFDYFKYDAPDRLPKK